MMKKKTVHPEPNLIDVAADGYLATLHVVNFSGIS
jgi:hypothetical protein